LHVFFEDSKRFARSAATHLGSAGAQGCPEPFQWIDGLFRPLVQPACARCCSDQFNQPRAALLNDCLSI